MKLKTQLIPPNQFVFNPCPHLYSCCHGYNKGFHEFTHTNVLFYKLASFNFYFMLVQF